MSLITSDPRLVGYWPLHEPSGAPLWRNYAQRAQPFASGLSLHFNVHTGGSVSADVIEASWPGLLSFNHPASGIEVKGLQVIGDGGAETTRTNTFYNNCLILGHHASEIRAQITPPASDGSGFTIGGWIYPNSDGANTFVETSGLVALRHAIISRTDNYDTGETPDGIDGYVIGVSGELQYGAQNSQPDPNNPDRTLTLFAYASDVILTTPIESGKFTHFTFTYEYDSGGDHIISLYKEGALVDSDIITRSLAQDNSEHWNRPLSIGGTESATASSPQYYNFASGHEHVVSGLYFFDNRMNASDVADIHNGGGVQIDPSVGLADGISLDISSSNILLYVDGRGKGYSDAGFYRNHLQSLYDSVAIDDRYITPIPGANKGAAYWRETNTITPLVANSGLSLGIANSDFTIAGRFAPNAINVSNTTWCLSVGGQNLVNHGRLMHVDYDTTTNNPQWTIAQAGDSAISLEIEGSGYQNHLRRSWQHLALVYDHSTGGAALYTDGELNSSGTLDGPLYFGAITTSGFPLIFLGANTNSHILFDGNKGDDNAGSEFFVADRILLPEEIRGLALSGVSTSSFDLTPFDTRLKAYWRCDEPSGAPLIRDLSVYGASGIQGTAQKAHLLPRLNNKNIDLYVDGHRQDIDPLSSLISPLGGITSGAFIPMGGSQGVDIDFEDSASSFVRRFAISEISDTVREPCYNGDLALSFEVIPSGNISNSLIETDSYQSLFNYGELGDGWAVLLSSYDVTDPNVQLILSGKSSTSVRTQLASGTLTKGLLHKVLVRVRFTHEDRSATGDDDNAAEFQVWVDGSLVNSNIIGFNDSNFGPVALSDHRFAIGAASVGDTLASVDTQEESGLGQTVLREIAYFIGVMSAAEAENLASNGISSFSSTPEEFEPFTRVSHTDLDLKGYWRFNDPNGSNSGLDLSIAGNDFRLLANEIGGNAANQARFFQGPYKGYTEYNVQASGIEYVVAPQVAPFAASGSDFDDPENGFTIAFRALRDSSVTINAHKVPIAYGPVSRSSFAVPQDMSWSVFFDDDSGEQGIWLVVSEDGGYQQTHATPPTASGAAVIGLGTIRGGVSPEIYPTTRHGYPYSPQLQGFCHYAFTYNANNKIASAFFNGELVDQYPVNRFHTPDILENKMLCFFNPIQSPWSWTTTRTFVDSAMTDIAYFSRSLDISEIRYLAASGVGFQAPTTTSGIVGGFIQGLGVASGVFGGYLNSIAALASGFFGGFMSGQPVPTASGFAGGYLVGVDTTSGIFGGYIQSIGINSGVMGGYIQALAITSGIAGGFINSGTSGEQYFDAYYNIELFGAQDFDAELQIKRFTFQDFDAQINLYINELPPYTVIEVPVDDVADVNAPYTGWFKGSGVPIQGKTIDSTTWDYGDFSSKENGIPSGQYIYVQDHTYSLSGIYHLVFKTIDSDGITASDSRVINIASGVSVPDVRLTAIPQEGNVPLTVQFTTSVSGVPAGTSIITKIVDFGDGQSTLRNNPSHTYTQPGKYVPRYIVKDSRGLIITDSLTVGVNN